MARYPDWHDGEWVHVQRRGFKFMCCHCAATHTMDFKLVPSGPNSHGKEIFVRARLDKRATSAARRAKARTIVVET